ncbi:hypothetical protein Taro_008560 [Colocasia esculenta]|uniref:Reticulon-like protein n=1 Tax=Colocasia esculenta TaxID=4460 RepID=A0A843U7E3_COLES|nr:hypothetical protein [Colocasia esculenta]
MATEVAAGDAATSVCTVIGGRSSFIGRSLVAMLLRSPAGWTVRIADSHPFLQLDPDEERNPILSDSIQSGRVSYFQVDVRDGSQISRAIEGSSVVFYMGASDSTSRSFYDQYKVIVQGTKNIINACRHCKVERLIYNSSADVVFDGIHDICHGNESSPYPFKFEDRLNDLRAQAEALILSSNSADGLSTCALRPSNPFGPGDSHFIPSIVNEAKSRWAKFFIRSGRTMCDYTYVENIAHAHVCAENALRSGIAPVAGEPFFITNLQPMETGEFASAILDGLGYQRSNFHVPHKLLIFLLMLVGWAYKKFDLLSSPSYLRVAFLRSFLCIRAFDCSKAQKIIGYSPVISLEEGIMSTTDSFSHLARGSPYMRELDLSKSSNVEKLLGSGKVADILLWRDETKTFAYALGLFLFLHWFLLSERTFLTSIAKLLLLVSVILFGHGRLPPTMFGFTIDKISPFCFEVSQTTMRSVLMSLSSVWNRGLYMVNTLARGEDWSTFLGVRNQSEASSSSSKYISICLLVTISTFR